MRVRDARNADVGQLADLKWRWKIHRWFRLLFNQPPCDKMPEHHAAEHVWVIGTTDGEMHRPLEAECCWCNRPVFRVKLQA